MRLPADVNRRVGRAMHDYAMLDHGDRILVAVSGGMDSLVLARVLLVWQRKAPIEYSLHVVHVDMDPGYESPGKAAREIAACLAAVGLHLHILPARWRPDRAQLETAGTAKDVCFQCARSRRTQLFAWARRFNCNKIAFGHHRDDIIETFLLNLTCSGNISTMAPRQDLFSGRLTLIRPLAYLDKRDIEALGADLKLQPVSSSCPLGEKTRRLEIRRLAEDIYQRIPGSKEQIFAALGNVRSEYLLKQVGAREE
jgi:tRNA 2-thiocytidine biosynthesis protein TtcA